MTDEKKPYDVTIGHNKAAFARFMEALVKYKARVTDSFMLTSSPRPHDSVFLRVFLRPEDEEAFKALVKPQDMCVAPKVSV